MKYHCSGCSYIYDESIGDEDLNIEENTLFDNLPNDFFCPFCETHKDDFILFGEEINYPLDVRCLTPKEQEHFPKISIFGEKLSFLIDENTHNSKKDNFIFKVSLYDDTGDEIDFKKFNFGDEVKGDFDLDYLDSFELRVFCIKEGIFSTGFLNK
ncbi:rubredoxin [Candidatus Gracilibacteria bacterium]|nr:rubredoxin [Candidatus Gracilibacteria bacterium]